MIRRPPRSTPFPTRRSSDLHIATPALAQKWPNKSIRFVVPFAPGGSSEIVAQQIRSEEHTSELQSQSNLVCRLLLEKKKVIHHVSQATKQVVVWHEMLSAQ